MDFGSAGRKALVCGASAGLGLACAKALAVEGVGVSLLPVEIIGPELASGSLRLPGVRPQAGAEVEQFGHVAATEEPLQVELAGEGGVEPILRVEIRR